MTRQLTGRERAVLEAMIVGANDHEPAAIIDPSDRAAWRDTVPHLVVDSACECGACPSISLVINQQPGTDAVRGDRPGRGSDDDRLVLSASAPGAYLLLFIDRGVPSYLELAPLDDDAVFTEFPAVSQLQFDS